MQYENHWTWGSRSDHEEEHQGLWVILTSYDVLLTSNYVYFFTLYSSKSEMKKTLRKIHTPNDHVTYLAQ